MNDRIIKSTNSILKRPVSIIFYLSVAVYANLCMLITADAISQTGKEVPVITGSDGRLVYTADSLGNRVPDFSYCGYMAGEKPIPDAPIRIVVPATEGDATIRIQSAIDY